MASFNSTILQEEYSKKLSVLKNENKSLKEKEESNNQ